MSDPFANYDKWLEAPYQEMCKEQDAFVDWCERHEWDPNEGGAWGAYQAWCEDDREIEPENRDEELDWDDLYYNELPQGV